jgi:hypothetical protein
MDTTLSRNCCPFEMTFLISKFLFDNLGTRDPINQNYMS